MLREVEVRPLPAQRRQGRNDFPASGLTLRVPELLIQSGRVESAILVYIVIVMYTYESEILVFFRQ